jgi:hypothetical protein
MGNSAESNREFAKVQELHATEESLASKMLAAPPPLPQ